MSKLLSFLGGAGKGFLEGVEKAETNAKEEALLRVKRLTESYEKVKEENGKLTNSLKAEERWIKTYYPDATPEQIAFLQGSPDALQAVKKMDNPRRISLSEVINIKAANEASSVVIDNIQNMPDVADAVGSKIKEAMPAYRRGLAGIYDEFGEQAGKSAEMRYARAMGVDVQTMEALKPMQRPAQAGTIDMAKLVEPPEFKELKDKAQVDLLKAQDSGDAAQINKAQEKLVRVTAIEDFNKTKNKTEAQIQSDLITEIQEKQAAGDKQGASLATALLRQRQALAKAPGDGKTDADKITQTNLIQVAQRARTAVIQDTLPPGTFVTSTDAEGNVVTTLRDLSQSDLFRKGSAIAANATIKEMTKPDGTPRSEMHKNAMMSAGIRFDDAGKAIKVPVPELPVRGAKPAAQASPAPAVTPAPAPAGRGTIRQQTAPAAAPPAATPSKTGAVLKWNPDKGDWE
jgi:hypothetical protein